MRKTLVVLTILAMSTFLLACGGGIKKVECSVCGTEIEINADEYDSGDLVLCDDCAEKAFQ